MKIGYFRFAPITRSNPYPMSTLKVGACPDASYQIRLHRNDKKTTPDAESAETESERGNLNNSDTNGNDIKSLSW